jgi:hypothetical protein
MLSLLVLCVLHGVSALNPIVVKGTKLYDSVTKERFMMRGLAYAPDKYFNAALGGDSRLIDKREEMFDDAHEAWWGRDIPFLKALNVNVIRIYEIDPFKPHGKIMKALEDAGIYVIVGLTKSAPDVALPAGTPSPGCFRASMMDSVERIILNLAIYPNLLSFVVGNEIANAVPLFGTDPVETVRGYLAMPCVKALARDARKFMKNCPGLRSVPLMYAATDFENPAKQIVADYLTCDQTEEGGAVDIYGINVYTWCARASTVRTQSSYGVLVDQFRYYNIPLILSEFGCNQGDFRSTAGNNWTKQRTWKSAGPSGLFSNEMKDGFSGGLAYQYSMTANDYGLVLLPGYMANQPAVVALDNYYNLQGQFALDMALQTQWNEKGAWTAADECTWVPVSGKSAPACPTVADISKMFSSTSHPINVTQYPATIWYDPLPVLARTPLPCVTGPLPIPTKCEHLAPSPPTASPPSPAPTAGNCEAIRKLPGCEVDLKSLNGSQTDRIFSDLCGIFAQQYAPDLKWCSTVFDGSHKACTAQQQIDYALQVWSEWASQCCVPLKDALPCTAYPLEPSIAPSVETAPTFASAPTNIAPTAPPAPTTVSTPTAPTATSPTVTTPTADTPTTAIAPTERAPSSPTPVMTNPTMAQSPTVSTGEQVVSEDGGSGPGVAIGVSVSLVVVLVGLAVAFFLYRRAKARRAHENGTMFTPLVDSVN